MRISRVALGLAVVAPASALLVGCGGGQSDDERYGEQFDDVARPFTAALVDLGNALGTATSRKQVSAALSRADDSLAEARDDFAALDPPDDVAETQRTLVSAIGKFERRIAETREAARSANDRKFAASVADFNSESQQFAAALGELRMRLEDAGVPIEAAAGTDSG